MEGLKEIVPEGWSWASAGSGARAFPVAVLSFIVKARNGEAWCRRRAGSAVRAVLDEFSFRDTEEQLREKSGRRERFEVSQEFGVAATVASSSLLSRRGILWT